MESKELTLNERLINIQSKLNAPKSQTNKFGNYKYRSCEDILSAVKPLLLENSCTLTISDEVVLIGERYYIKATATLKGGFSDLSVSALAREEETKKGMDSSQITGSSSSYARKYALNGLFAIDDTKDADTQDNTEKSAKEEPEQTSDAITQKQLKWLETVFGSEQGKKLLPTWLQVYRVDTLSKLTAGQAKDMIDSIRQQQAEKQNAK